MGAGRSRQKHRLLPRDDGATVFDHSALEDALTELEFKIRACRSLHVGSRSAEVRLHHSA